MFKLLIVAVLAVLVGCASAPVHQDLSKELKASNVAVAYYMHKKNIHYTEMVYKVLWNQIETQDAAFEGMWDIDRDLSTRLTTLLANEGLMAQSIQDVLGKSEYAAFNRVMAGARWDNGAVRKKEMRLDDATTAALAKRDIRYVIIEQRHQFEIVTTSFMDSVNATTDGLLVIYDVQARREIYAAGVSSVTNIKTPKSPRDIEANKLARLKTAVHKWMDESQQFYVQNLRLADAP